MAEAETIDGSVPTQTGGGSGMRESAAELGEEDEVVVPRRTFQRLTRRRGGLLEVGTSGGQSTAAMTHPFAAATQRIAGGRIGLFDEVEESSTAAAGRGGITIEEKQAG